MQNTSVSLADKACLFPVVQQVVGVVTVLSNTVKVIMDLFLLYTTKRTKEASEKETDSLKLKIKNLVDAEVQKILKKQGELKKQTIVDMESVKKQAEACVKEKIVQDVKTPPEEGKENQTGFSEDELMVFKAVRAYSDIKKNLACHAAHIRIGAIRAIPIVSTIRSARILARGKSY